MGSSARCVFLWLFVLVTSACTNEPPPRSPCRAANIKEHTASHSAVYCKHARSFSETNLCHSRSFLGECPTQYPKQRACRPLWVCFKEFTHIQLQYLILCLIRAHICLLSSCCLGPLETRLHRSYFIHFYWISSPSEALHNSRFKVVRSVQ